MSEVDQRNYIVVVNHEEQYSIWLADRDLPLGWSAVPIPDSWLGTRRDAGISETTSKQTCLDYIAEIWTDMRPLSLRKAMGA
jgi:MbtH protein